MTEYKNVKANFDKIMRPNTAYVTFRTDKAFHTMLKDDQDVKFEYRDEKCKISRALQPSNIQWENFEFTKRERRVRYIIIMILMVVFGFSYYFFAVYAL